MSVDWKRTEVLISTLLERRSSPPENELCKLCRQMSETEKLSVIQRIANRNSRLAAGLAACSQLAVPEQVNLLRCVIEEGKSNAIKNFVAKLFARRMGDGKFAAILKKLEPSHPQSVNLAAFYYLAATSNQRRRHRNTMIQIHERTRHSLASGSG